MADDTAFSSSEIGFVGSSQVDVVARRPIIGTAATQRHEVVSQIKVPMLSVATSFTVTLMLFPGVVTEIESDWGDWTPISMIAAFNLGDLSGKLLPFIPYRPLRPSSWVPKMLLRFTIVRVLYIPLIVLCVVPLDNVTIPGKVWPLVFVITLGITG